MIRITTDYVLWDEGVSCTPVKLLTLESIPGDHDNVMITPQGQETMVINVHKLLKIIELVKTT